MSLSALLERERNKTRQRQRRKRVDEMKRSPSPALSKVETLERVAAALTGNDCLADIERLLRARGHRLWVVWRGRFGQVYTHSDADGYQILQVADKKRHTIDIGGMVSTDMGQRIGAILDQHRCELAAFWRGDELILQLASREVSDVHALRLASCRDGRKCSMMFSDESEVHA